MDQAMSKFRESPISNLYHSFSPASRAAILFAVPFTVVDAIHYYTAGTALIFSFPLLVVIYLSCSIVAARISTADDPETGNLSRTGRLAALRLWMISTVINTLISVMLGFATLGGTALSTIIYLCLFAPFHALGSALIGGLGGWLYQEMVNRTKPSKPNG